MPRQDMTESAASSGGCRPIRRAASAARRRRGRATAPPSLVVREPEARWWAAQDHLEEPVESDHGNVTVAALREWDTGRDPGDVTMRLAQLAVRDELLVVFGAGPGPATGHQAVVAGLQTCLPRHDVVTLEVDDRTGGLLRAVDLLGRFLDGGRLPVLVTAAEALHEVTAEIASHLRADRVLRVFRTPVGVNLYPVWRRDPRPGFS